jgi:hypothetical protein
MWYVTFSADFGACMQVLQYALPSSTRAAAAAAEHSASDFLLQVLDNALPQQLLLHLQQVFAPAAPFWRQHSYGRVGYFSYFFRLVSCLQRVTAKLLTIALSACKMMRCYFGSWPVV